MNGRRHVGSTYRLQLNGIGFAGATRLVPFLHRLSVETCYVSPVTRARAHSSHGYDVVDPTVLDPSLGTAAEFEEFLTALASHSMGLLLDIVPNHMAASVENPFFADVLRHGRDSEYGSYFDIAWDEQGGKIVLPVLGKPLADALDAGEIQLVTDPRSSQPAIGYFDKCFPIAPGSVGADLSDLLAKQHYRLADWRVANREVNYRRFFDINELIGVRQEDPRVFAETHRLVAALMADQRIVGLRVDHVDGLYDPAKYLARLRELTSQSDPDPVIVVEKILAPSEEMPDWPVDGTTGYEFADQIIGLFIDAQGAAAMARATGLATGDDRSFAERSIDAKRRILDDLFPHQLEHVTSQFGRAIDGVAESDADRTALGAAIRELTTHLDVYRTYRRADVAARFEDLQRISAAADRAHPTLSDGAAIMLDRVLAVLTGSVATASPASLATSAWQQLTGPVAAKGVEDTAMYDSGHLLAAADVGSDPDRPALSRADFHAAMARRAQRGRFALSSTSTHDSKRSHDVRCRLAALSETAADWEATVIALDREAVSMRGSLLPDTADRRYIYETLVGAWPLVGPVGSGFAARIRDHLVKAAREAKRHSNWLDPDPAYEDALGGLAQGLILGERPVGRRLIEATVASVECASVSNSLASVVLKVTAPGVPDVYQGDDSWLFVLVDPDNRAPLDATGHALMLTRLPRWSDDADHSEEVAGLLAGWRSGAVKQFVLRNSLETRRRERGLFASGHYQPLEVVGRHRDHVLAFARIHQSRWAVSVVPRCVQSLSGPGRLPVGAATWTDAEVVVPPACPGTLTDVLTGRSISLQNGRIAVSSVLATLPVALLVGG